MQKRWYSLSFFTLFLGACTQTGQYPVYQESQPEIVFSSWYLRGIFNWWEAKPSYQLKQGSNGWYVDVELIGDGQPNDFKFSDNSWTIGQTCGGSYKGQLIGLQDSVALTCGSKAENMRFTPARTGTYRFSVKGSPNTSLQLTINKL